MIVGIDLGTTKSVIGYWHENKPRIVQARGTQSLPSEVFFLNDKVAVGHQPTEKEYTYVAGFKRHLGRDQTIRINSTQRTHPQYVAAIILKELVSLAELDMKEMGYEEQVDEAVIAIPSHFDISQRRATLEAASIAGLKVKRLINEATASALEYTRNRNIGEKLLVIDLGGGTLDLSYIETISEDKEPDSAALQVLRIEGDTFLGGLDFDLKIRNWLQEQLLEQFGTENIDQALKESGTKTDHDLQKEIAEKKKRLSDQKEIRLHVPAGIIKNGVEILPEFILTREKFLDITEPLMKRIVTKVKPLLNSENKTKVLLLGRAGHTYGLKSYLEEKLNITCYRDLDAETCVAKGAIIQSAIFTGALKERLVMEVLQDNYGVELEDNGYHIFLHKGKIIPANAAYEFQPNNKEATELRVNILKGGHAKASKNTLVQTIVIKRPSDKDQNKIKIDFKMNTDMVLEVDIQGSSFIISSPDGLSNDEVSKYKQSISKKSN
ncbi:MAG: Hsp70 family protein [Reichenbachiella sp.]|uniref:Hsp70 family protein n=1 Tax=Reichenbachiella sp. TaxID=2184521 RepID=UPI00296653E3|nr:Hsp70 family protein [Reichenbachiella sp.]MDW3210311.1 Hsp70 family protein [Reichenbachiella sp.]